MLKIKQTKFKAGNLAKTRQTKARDWKKNFSNNKNPGLNLIKLLGAYLDTRK
jgi:hypothetical protein